MATTRGVGGGAVVILLAFSVAGCRPAVVSVPPEPRMRCVGQVDLGEHELNETVFGHFTVENAGGGVLELSAFGTSCSCAGVEVEEGGVAKRVESVAIPAGRDATLTARISVGAPVGTPQAVAVSFRTNDPVTPYHQVRLVVTKVLGGVCCVPSSVNFGALLPSQQAVRRVILYENGVEGRRLTGVRTAAAERFEVKAVPLTPEEAAPHPTHGRPFAAFEITPHTKRANSLSGDVAVYVEGGRTETGTVSVTGAVVSGVSVSPASLFLPADGAGEEAWSGSFLVSGRDDAAITAALDDAPPDLTLSVVRQSESAYRVNVGMAAVDRSLERRRGVVCLKVNKGDQAPELVHLNVFYPGAKP